MSAAGCRLPPLWIMDRGFVIHKPRSCARVSDKQVGSSTGQVAGHVTGQVDLRPEWQPESRPESPPGDVDA